MKKITKKSGLICLATMFAFAGKAQIITTLVGDGTGAYTGDGGQADMAEVNRPNDVILDNLGNLYIADLSNYVIRKVNTAGIISTVAGNGIMGFAGDSGQATNAELNGPSAITIDAVGNMYIADGKNRVRKVNTAGIITTIAGGGNCGSSYCGDGGQASAAELYGPSGLTFDALGNLYIADQSNNRIRKINTSGIITTVVGNGTMGFGGDNGQAVAAEINQPSGVVFDAAGNLYIADTGNNRIRKVNTSGIINTFSGNGTIGFNGDGGQATATELNAPSGVSFDNIGNLYIADEGNNMIRMINTSGIISTAVGNGTPGFIGDGGQATDAELNSPTSVVIDTMGNLYITDYANNRIRMVRNAGNTTGIKQIADNKEQITIYPNPSNGNFVIEPNNTASKTMQMYDINGKLVLSQVINGKTNISATSLNEGVYNISITSNEGIVNKRLIVVK